MARGLSPTRSQARQVIRDGLVRVNRCVVDRPGRTVAVHAAIEVDDAAGRYVSRGGRKLAPALDHCGLDPRGMRVLDVGAGTGGFTDVLLQRGALQIVAVDVGWGQLSTTLLEDSRVISHERTDVRNLELIEPSVDAVVADLSFIRLQDVLDSLLGVAPFAQWMILLFKPQFELPAAQVPRDGVIKNVLHRKAALANFRSWVSDSGFVEAGHVPSVVSGGSGNWETFIHLVPPWPKPH